MAISGDIGRYWEYFLTPGFALSRIFFHSRNESTTGESTTGHFFYSAFKSTRELINKFMVICIYIYILCTYVYIIYPWFGDVPADWLNPHKTPSPSCGKNRVVFVCWSWVLGIRLTELFRTMFDFFIVIEWTKQQNMVLKVIQYNLCSS